MTAVLHSVFVIVQFVVMTDVLHIVFVIVQFVVMTAVLHSVFVIVVCCNDSCTAQCVCYSGLL